MTDLSSRRPRILLVGQGPPTSGGIPSFVTTLARDPWLAERAEIEFLNTTPETVKRPGALSLANLGQMLLDARNIRRRGKEVDVVHLNLAPAPTLPLLKAIVLALAARSAGARVVLHAHTGRLHTSAGSIFYRSLLRLVGRAVDVFVVVSRPALDVVRKTGTARVERIENGIDFASIATGPKETRPIVTFVGTVCERKGVLDLCRALVTLDAGNHLSDVKVQIIGDAEQEGPGEFERMKAAFDAAGLAQVELPGALPRKEVLQRLARSQVFCLPSYWEGFPLSVLEAMAAETAVVASGVGDVPEMLDQGKAGVLVEPRDPAGLATALRELLEDRERISALGRAARARVEERYDQRVMARRLLRIYQELADA